tara:strand:- start:3829 stop:4158 length:330 start_codon:yes stop_codon:yes gene_type:complete
MANVAKGWAIGDTVWVHYIGSVTNQFIPVSRVVSKANVNSSTNEAVVEFTSGSSVQDGAVVAVYTTQALCAAGIVTWMIAQSVAVCTLDATTSEASTSGQASTTLGRIG